MNKSKLHSYINQCGLISCLNQVIVRIQHNIVQWIVQRTLQHSGYKSGKSLFPLLYAKAAKQLHLLIANISEFSFKGEHKNTMLIDLHLTCVLSAVI